MVPDRHFLRDLAVHQLLADVLEHLGQARAGILDEVPADVDPEALVGDLHRPAAQFPVAVDDQDFLALLGQQGSGAQAGSAGTDDDDIDLGHDALRPRAGNSSAPDYSDSTKRSVELGGRGVSYVPVPGARLWVEEHGSGLPLVFLHGGTGTAAYDWGPVLPALQSRYRVVTMDMRGHGSSYDPDVELGIDRFGLDLVHVMRALGIPRAVLVGFSVGANSLLKLVPQRPDLALGLITIGASVAGDASRVPQLLAGPWPAELINLEHRVGDGPDYWQRLRTALAHDWANNLALTDDLLRRITCPTLVCHGDRDRVAALSEALQIHRAIAGSQLFVAPGSGHQVQMEQPAMFVQAVDSFVARLQRRRLARTA